MKYSLFWSNALFHGALLLNKNGTFTNVEGAPDMPQ